MEYTQEIINGIVAEQRAFFRTDAIPDVGYRIARLKKLKQAVIDHEELLEQALYEDLGRSRA